VPSGGAAFLFEDFPMLCPLAHRRSCNSLDRKPHAELSCGAEKRSKHGNANGSVTSAE
jgi:hypothetical protein